MKLTWSEASVFAFVWACALGYIVASRILEWNFERFLPSNWYFVVKSVYLIATRDLSNLWLQFFLSQNQGFMRLFEKTVLK